MPCSILFTDKSAEWKFLSTQSKAGRQSVWEEFKGLCHECGHGACTEIDDDS